MLIVLLALAAIASLILDVVLGQIILAYVALGLCLFGVVVSVTGMVRRRRAQRRIGSGEPPIVEDELVEGEPVGGELVEGELAEDADDHAESSAPPPAAEPSPMPVSPDLPGGESEGPHFVHVIPGHRRYHLPGCRLLTPHADEEITLAEAREEGFTACTTCNR